MLNIPTVVSVSSPFDALTNVSLNELISFLSDQKFLFIAYINPRIFKV